MMKKSKKVKATKVLCTLLVLGATGITAYAGNTAPPDPVAASASKQRPADTDPGSSSSSAIPSQETDDRNSENAAKQTELAAQAAITEAEAISAAQAANPGYTFTVKELEDESGTLFYELKGTDANGADIKCHVNAMDGGIDPKAYDEENDTEDAAKQAELAAQAAITETEAISAAQTAVPGWNFSKSELDSENGTILYELKGTDADGKEHHVL